MTEQACRHDLNTVVRALDLLAVSYRLARAEHPYWREAGRRARQLCPEVCAEVVHGRRAGTVPAPGGPEWDAYLEHRTGLTVPERARARRRPHSPRPTQPRRIPAATAPGEKTPGCCIACGQPLPRKATARGYSWHRKCRPIACLGCGRTVAKNTTRKLRCTDCGTRPPDPSRSPAPAARRPTVRTLWEHAARERQAAEQQEARRQAQLSPGPSSRTPPPIVILRGGLPDQNRRRH